MHLPSISSRPPARAHSLQQPVPFTVPTSSWRCTNSNRTSNATSNDFPMQPNSLQLTNQVPPRLTRTKCPLSHASPTPKKRFISFSCQTLNVQTFALCHPLTIGMHLYLRRYICDSRTSPVLQMMGNFEQLQGLSLSNCHMRMRRDVHTANHTATEAPTPNPWCATQHHSGSIACICIVVQCSEDSRIWTAILSNQSYSQRPPECVVLPPTAKAVLTMSTDPTHSRKHQQLSPATSR